MCRPETKRTARPLAAALALAGYLGGCSDAYWDHRETIALSGGDAVAANTVTQVVDPWPPNSGNKTIPYNGQKMQVAVERYRNGAVIPPISAVTSDAALPPPVAPPLAAASSSGTQNASSGAPSATAAAASQ
jgi:hypothetical protein